MKSYLKFLSRNKLYTAIEAAGLIVSLAFIILIATSVHDQRRFSRPGPGQENLFLLGNVQDPSLEYRSIEALSSMPEVVRTAAFARRQALVQVAGEKAYSQVLMTDPSLLEMIPLAVRSGSPDLFVSGPGVLISESAARKFFPGTDPLGQEVLIGDSIQSGGNENPPTPLPIVAVIEDPTWSLLNDFEFMVSIQAPTPYVRSYRDSDMRHTGTGHMVLTLAEIAPGTDLQAFSDKYAPQAFWFMMEEQREGRMLVPYGELYFLETDHMNELRQGKHLYLLILIILGLVLLVSALLNYVNLSLALSGFRAKEMATRQLVGDDRRGVLLRSLRESLFFTLVCYALAVPLARAILPLLNSLRPVDMTVLFRVVPDGHFWLMSLFLVTGIGVLAGLIPALMLSSWKPMDVVSGRLRRQRKMVFNRICIIAQAVLALVLIVMTLTLHAQLRHLETLDLGVSPADDVFCFMQLDAPIDSGLMDRLSASPLVEELGTSFGFPTHTLMISSFKRDAALIPIECDSTAFRLLGFRPLETWSGLQSNTIWLTEESRNYFGDSNRESIESELMGVRYLRIQNGVGGILENYRKMPVNGVDHFGDYPGQLLYVVRIREPRSLKGLVMRTGPDHKVFERFFKETVNQYYKERFGIGEILSYDNGYLCGYLDDLVAKDYDSLHRYVRLVDLFCLMAVLLAMLGLVAMSTYYAGTRSKDIAIRKVFGGTVDSEAWQGIRSYMLWIALAAVVGVPAGVLAARRFLEGWPERISGYWWIFVVAVLLLLAVSFVSVVWQTLKAARTNPAVELKKE